MSACPAWCEPREGNSPSLPVAGGPNREELPAGDGPSARNHCQPFPHSPRTSPGCALQPPPSSRLPAAPPSPPQGPARPRTTTQHPAPSAPRGNHARLDPRAGPDLRASPEPLAIPARRQRGRRCATSRQRRQRRRAGRGKGVRAAKHAVATPLLWPRPLPLGVRARGVARMVRLRPQPRPRDNPATIPG